MVGVNWANDQPESSTQHKQRRFTQQPKNNTFSPDVSGQLITLTAAREGWIIWKKEREREIELMCE